MGYSVPNKIEKILVTGSSGAIGTILCPFLMKQGYDVRGFDLQYGGTTSEFILGNIKNIELINHAIQDVDAIIHLAACSDDSGLQSELLTNNVENLKVLLDEASKHQLKRIIFASSIQTVNFTQKDKYYSVNDRSPFNFYGLTKLWGEDLLELFSTQNDIPVIIARLGWFIRSEKEFQEAYNYPNGRNLYLSPNDLCEFFLKCLKKDEIKFEKLYATSVPVNSSIFDIKLSSEKIGYIPKDVFPSNFNTSTFSMVKNEEIILIHLTDLHILKDKKGILYGVNTFDKLKGVIQHIRINTKDIDGIIITGDLSEDGSAESYFNIKEEIDKLCIPSYWLPGNHDNFEHIPQDIASVHIYESTTLGDWSLIFLDTSVNDEDFGLLSVSELERLEQFLIKNKDSQILICMHHPPIDVQSEFIDSIGLKNKEVFWDVLSKYSNVKGILVGHIHQEFNKIIHGVRISSPFSTCVQWVPFSKDFKYLLDYEGYQIIRLKADGSISSKPLSLSKTKYYKTIDQ